jgi:hypothetical protein
MASSRFCSKPTHHIDEKAGTMWETNTMAKASLILAAMDRHPDEVIVWLDVDCIVHGDLSPLADIRGDVAFRMHSKFRRHHKGTRFRAQSGTMVFRPTPEARQFVEAWKQASERAPYGEIDHSSQVVALAQSIGTTFVPLPLIYCVNPDERGKVPGAVVQHDSAAVHFPKVSGWRRYVGRMIGRGARYGIAAVSAMSCSSRPLPPTGLHIALGSNKPRDRSLYWCRSDPWIWAMAG